MGKAKSAKNNDYSEAVERVRSLLSRWLEAGVDLFLELNKVDKSGVWRTPQNATFADFLSREFPNALGLNRYQNVMDAIGAYGEEYVRRHGVEACHAMSNTSVTSSPARLEETKRSLDRYEQVNGVPATPREIRKIVRGVVGGPAPVHPSTTQVRRQDTLAAENAALKEQLRVANRRIRELEREVERLKKPRAA